MHSFNNIFYGKNVLITGHTGFKGSWLSVWMHLMGAKVFGLSIDIVSNPSNFVVSQVGELVKDFRADIRDLIQVESIVQKVQPDFVFHMAAQSLVKTSYQKPLETITTNAIGTCNILESLRVLEKEVVGIIITSDKAYDNLEWEWGYRETDRLGGKDPYSASKGMAELAIRSYTESFFKTENTSNVRIGITRAGNVIGGGDWAVDRIVPDCMRACFNNDIVDIRNPYATRPWQHVLEPLSGYLVLAKELSCGSKYNGEAYNFGPSANQNTPVSRLIDEMSKHWSNVKWQDVSKGNEKEHEAGLLKLNCDKALADLNWHSVLQFEDTIAMTVNWYKHFYQNQKDYMYEYTTSQIKEYTEIARAKNLSWADND